MIKIFFTLFILFTSITSLFCEDDPRLRVYPPQGIMAFKGLDEKSSPTAVRDSYATEAQNVKFSLTGGVSKRKGYSLVGGILDIPDVDFQAVTGLYYTKLSSGTEYRIVICGDRFYYDVVGTWTQVSGSTITYAQNNQFVFTTALDSIIFTNNSDRIKKWTGSGPFEDLSFSGLTSTVTQAKCVAWFKNHLIFGNTVEAGVSKKTRIRWSNIGYIGTWSDDDYIDIDALGGQEINGMAVLYDNLFVFMTDSIYKVSYVGGDEIYVVSKVVEGTGCIAKNSIQNISFGTGQAGIVFLSKDKTINFFDGINVATASTLISTTMDALNTSRLPYAVSAEDGQDYYLCVTTGGSATENNLLLDLQYDTVDWSKHTQIDANAMAKVLDIDGNTQIYFGNTKSFVYELEDASLNNDIAGYSGVFDEVDVYTTSTASGLQVVYDSDASFSCTGAIVRITSGTSKGEERVIVDCITTGVVVSNAFTVTPDNTSVYSIGDIDAIYTTKWYDLGEPARRKQFGELYIWAEEEGNMSISVSYAQDFKSYSSTQNVSLLGTGAVWGTAVWGTDVWGGQDALLKVLKLKGEGRYIKFKIREADIDETFNIYGFSVISWAGDVL